MKPAVCIATVFMVFALSCSQQQTVKPTDPNAPSTFWGIAYNHSLNNGLEGRGSGQNDRGSSISQWEAILTATTGLTSVAVDDRNVWVTLPSDGGLDLNDPQSFVDFVIAYKQSESSYLEIRSAGEYCILLGINTPANVPADDGGGFGFARGAFGSLANFEFAIRFVEKERIFYVLTIPGGENIEKKWLYTQYVVLHELGHGKGLRTQNNPGYDDVNHGGSNVMQCVMISPLLPNPVPPNFLFCGRHIKILRECLNPIQAFYDPSATCAAAPYL